MKSPHALVVLATRAGSHVCAAYAQTADAREVIAFYRNDVATMARMGARVVPGPDHLESTRHGLHLGHVSMVLLPSGTPLFIAVLTYQDADSPYQAALWEAVGPFAAAAMRGMTQTDPP